jgi:hypothetical protein
MAAHVSGGIASKRFVPAIFFKACLAACRFPSSLLAIAINAWLKPPAVGGGSPSGLKHALIVPLQVKVDGNEREKYQPGRFSVLDKRYTFLKFAALCEAFFYSACVL